LYPSAAKHCDNQSDGARCQSYGKSDPWAVCIYYLTCRRRTGCNANTEAGD